LSYYFAVKKEGTFVDRQGSEEQADSTMREEEGDESDAAGALLVLIQDEELQEDAGPQNVVQRSIRKVVELL
jgi:hypothetical protein